jgi:signal transduction histidine kinase
MMVRTRDIKLVETNRRLVTAQEERSRHMLTMTHQLKAPFAAIHANVQLFLKGHCGVLSDEALDVARRIAARSRRLATEIQEMLQLANLSSSSQKPPGSIELSLSEALNWCVEQVRPMAQERRIALDIDIQPARTKGVEDHLKMLFSNLLSNAVFYSYKGGRVGVQCGREDSSRAVVTISDEGIGVAAEKLPHIFNEHYRTKEAVRHNKESSGLGLAIVKHVTELHGIRLQVQTQPGTGTTFKLWFPCAAAEPLASGKKEIRNGLCDDC